MPATTNEYTMPVRTSGVLSIWNAFRIMHGMTRYTMMTDSTRLSSGLNSPTRTTRYPISKIRNNCAIFSAHDKTGAPITGTSTKDVDSTDATVAVAEMLDGKTAYARGAKLTGTMPNNGAVAGKITQKDGKYTIPMGFHDGSGSAEIDETEQAKLVPANIREGVTILGVVGSMSSSEGMKPQAKSVAPTFEQQTVLPDSDYNCLSQVTVNAIPATYVDNAAGGQTLTVGG